MMHLLIIFQLVYRIIIIIIIIIVIRAHQAQGRVYAIQLLIGGVIEFIRVWGGAVVSPHVATVLQGQLPSVHVGPAVMADWHESLRQSGLPFSAMAHVYFFMVVDLRLGHR